MEVLGVEIRNCEIESMVFISFPKIAIITNVIKIETVFFLCL